MKSHVQAIALIAAVLAVSLIPAHVFAQATAPAMAQPNSQMQKVLDQLAILNPKPIETLSANDARHQPTAADAVIELNQSNGTVDPKKLPALAQVEMKGIPADDGRQIPVRLYRPTGTGPFPAIVYFHGGGWVIAGIDTYDSSCRALVKMANAAVVSVDYRYAPEHKFPAAPEDCYAAFQYVANHAADFGADSRKVAVVGESAGGNLATVVCLMAKQRHGLMPIHQGLIYPVTNYAFDTQSYTENAQAKPLNASMMKWFFDKYLNSPSDGDNILVSPLRATTSDLQGLPPATIVTDQIDPLRSEGVDYGNKLAAAGVDVKAKTFSGVTHEFFGMGLVVDQAKDAETFMTDRLKDAFDAAK